MRLMFSTDAEKAAILRALCGKTAMGAAEEAIAIIKLLPEEEQESAAEALQPLFDLARGVE